MKEEYLIHNLFRRGLQEFERNDPQLSRLAELPYVHHPALEREIPLLTPGIYILTGGRQVGKTTLLKLLIARILKEENFPSERIFYLPCDTIDDFKGLLFEVDQFRSALAVGSNFVLFLDEITYVREWDRAVKSLADAGFFRNGSVLITGSDSCILKEAMMRFPGRRGLADRQDFHLFPLSFFEYVSLVDAPLSTGFEAARKDFFDRMERPQFPQDAAAAEKLAGHFERYLLTGGFMPAINASAAAGSRRTDGMALQPPWGSTLLPSAAAGEIPAAIYRTYVQWIVGDVLKRGKQEGYLREIIAALIPRMGKQITWHNLVGEMSIEHHGTVADYMEILSRMDVAVVVPALLEHKLAAAPKKAKKVFFGDPFIVHALRGWLTENASPFQLASELIAGQGPMKDDLVEGTISSLFCRRKGTFYIKAGSEVDIAIVREKRILPIEIKNAPALDRVGLKQILKYKRGIVAYGGLDTGRFEHLDVVPISLIAMLAA